MKGAVLLGDRKVELYDFPDPAPGEGEAIVEIKASGLCGSDLQFYRAPLGEGLAALGLSGGDGLVIAGHEPCGVVADLPGAEKSDRFGVGTRVMVHHYRGCAHCSHCLAGWTQMCDHGSTIYGVNGHGGHARYMKVPVGSLVALPDGLSFETGAAISCGTGTAYGALLRLDVSGRDTLAIFGQGPVGLSATRLAKEMGARVVAIDFSENRRQQALAWGAWQAIDPKACDVVEAIRELTGGIGASATLDATGVQTARHQAVCSAAKWGRVAFVGEGGDFTVDISQEVIFKQLSLYGSWTFSTSIQYECARFISERKIDIDSLFTDRWSLDDVAEAYRKLDSQASGKGVIMF